MITKINNNNFVLEKVTNQQRREFQRILGLYIGQFDSLHTRRAYLSDLRELFTFIGHVEINKIKSEEILLFKESIKSKGVSVETLARKISTIRSFFRWTEEYKFTHSNCAKIIRIPKLSNPIGKTPELSDGATKKLLESPNLALIVENRDYIILNLLFRYGMRSNEVSSVKKSDFCIDSGFHVLSIFGKGNHRRRIPIMPDLFFEIQKYCQRKGLTDNHSYLFTASVNNRTKTLSNRLTTGCIRQIVIKYAKRVGIDQRVTSHSGRVTACSNASENSASITELMDGFGWRSPSTVVRYQRRRGLLKNSCFNYVLY